MTTDDRPAIRDWRVPRNRAETIDLFTPGTPVRHLNPELSDWRGKVTPGPRNGQHIDNSGAVRVKWHAGTTPVGELPATGYYVADALEPDPENTGE